MAKRKHESWEYRDCRQCGERMLRDDFPAHRKTHDDAIGVERHTAYYPDVLYGQAQITLIEPEYLRASASGPALITFAGSRFMSPHVFVTGSDRDEDQPTRTIDLYLTAHTARELAAMLTEAADRVDAGDY